MPKVVLNKYELEMPREQAAESLIKRFNKVTRASNIIEDYRKHEAFLPKSIRRKEKQKKAKIRRIQLAKKHFRPTLNAHDKLMMKDIEE